MEYSRCFNPTKINKNKSTIRKEEEKANYSIKLLVNQNYLIPILDHVSQFSVLWLDGCSQPTHTNQSHFHTMKFLGSLVIELIWCMQLSVYDDGADDGLQNIS